MQSSFGQNSYSLELIDESTGQSLMGAHLIQTSQNGLKKYYLSDENGRVNLKGKDADQISISYTGFKTIDQKLGANLSQKIILTSYRRRTLLLHRTYMDGCPLNRTR